MRFFTSKSSFFFVLAACARSLVVRSCRHDALSYGWHASVREDPACKHIADVLGSFSMDDVVPFPLLLLPQGCDTPKFVPMPLKSGARFNHCAIVGGSTRINGSKWGSEIDSHDIVIRVNNHPWDPIDGGTKTDVQFITDDAQNRVPTRSFCSAKGCTPMIIGDYSFPDGCVSPVPWYLLNSNLQNATRQLVKSTTTSYPHSGMHLTLVAAKVCREISLYGIAAGEDALAAFWNLENAYIAPGHGDIVVNEFLVIAQMRRCGWDIREPRGKRFG